MKKLSKSIDLNFMKEQELTQVCLEQGLIILNFDEGLAIKITGAFSLNGKLYEEEKKSKAGYLLHILLKKKITDYRYEEASKNLILDFEDNNRIILHANPGCSDAYSLKYLEEVILF